jgi:hypothetical protein
MTGVIMKKSAKLWVVRHGERVDEVDRLWVVKNPRRHWDPPLTKVL